MRNLPPPAEGPRGTSAGGINICRFRNVGGDSPKSLSDIRRRYAKTAVGDFVKYDRSVML